MPDRYRIIFSRRAAADLEAICGYVGQSSPQGATSVARSVVNAIDSLEQLPHRYPVYSGRRSPSEAVRRMPVPPYLVYYQVNDATKAVGVVTIRHGARRQPRL